MIKEEIVVVTVVYRVVAFFGKTQLNWYSGDPEDYLGI